MFLHILTLIIALIISCVAGFFSVYGIGIIFSGSFIAATVMGGVLELGKIIAVSWLYRNFKQASLALKTYLIGAILVLSFITSLGIFGFLSRAHLEQTIQINTGAKSQIELLQTQITQKNEAIVLFSKQLDLITKAQESLIASKKAISSVRIGEDQQRNRNKINAEIIKLQTEKNDLELQKVKLENETKKNELDVGPIRYVAEAYWGKSDQATVDKTVRFLIIVIMLVFDPLAIALIIAANSGFIKHEEISVDGWTGGTSNLTITDNPDILKIHRNHLREIK